MKRKIIQATMGIMILLISYWTVQNPFSNQYLNSLKNESVIASVSQDLLREEINQKSTQYEILAKDAEIHRVWKATPGYNGQKVDIEASYKNMKKNGIFDEKLLVYKQISPKIHLDDLPAEAIYRGHPDKPMVSFLINVAWGNEYLPKMLEVLTKHHVKATFFLEGRWVKNNPDLAKLLVSAGHEIGNHSYTHPDMSRLSSQNISEELIKTNEVIEATIDTEISLFAPPSGSYRKEVVDIAARNHLKTIMWSVDTIDWQKPDPQTLINRVLHKVHNGAMILMHPTESTANSLDQLIVSIKSRGLAVSSVSDLLSEERIFMNK